MEKNRIWIVWSEDRRSNNRNYWSRMIGYLPGEQVPQNSLLWKALMDGDDLLRTEGGYGISFRGIYEKKSLATEHMKIEKKWRVGNHFFITELKPENK